MPATEASLLALRQLDEDHPARAVSVLPSNGALDCMLDKEQTRAHATTVGVPVPRTCLLTSPDAPGLDAPFPRVLKPTRSKVRMGGRWHTLAPAIVGNDAERTQVLETWLPHVSVQEQAYVAGVGQGINVLMNRGVVKWTFCYERIHELPLTGGGSAYRKSIRPSEDLLDAARRLLEPLAWHGVAMVECKRSKDGALTLMEVNPRLWGSLALPIDCGVDFPRGLAALASGMPLIRQPRYRVPHYTRSVLDDVVWMKANLRARHSDPLLHTRSRVLSVLQGARVFFGRETWDHFTPDDPRVGRRVVMDVVREHVTSVGHRVGRAGWRLAIERRHDSRFRNLLRMRRPVRRILFLCYGNICRSPFAEAVAAKAHPDLTVESSGFHRPIGRKSPESLQDVAAAMEVDLSAHRSARVTRAQVQAADLILIMDHDNWRRLAQEFPEARRRTTCLGLYADPPVVEIDDPYGADDAEIRRVLAIIRSAVTGLAKALDPK